MDPQDGDRVGRGRARRQDRRCLLARGGAGLEADDVGACRRGVALGSGLGSALGSIGLARAPVVVHEDVDDFARLPVRAGQRDEATGRVVVEVAGDGRRGDRLSRRGLGGRFGGGCRRGRRSPRVASDVAPRRSGLRRRLGGRLLASAPRSAQPRESARGWDRRSALRPGRRSARQGSRPAGIPAAPRAVGGVTGGRIGAPESSRFPAPARTAISGTATTSQDVDGAVESRTRRRSKGIERR